MSLVGVVSRRRVWLESMGVANGCGCKEVYRFPHINYPYIYTPLVSVLFCSSIPTFCSFFKCFSFLFQYFFVIKFYVLKMFCAV